MASYRIGQLADAFGLSRGTLIYYHRIGLLRPSARSSADYRVYSERDFQRLEQIVIYKTAGLSLHAIGDLLDQETGNDARRHLRQRLAGLNREIGRIRRQQAFILRLLENKTGFGSDRVMDKARWVALLEASGMDDAAMRQWHIEFEREMPEAHGDFLASLGIDAEEIAEIRSWSARGSSG